MTPGMRLATVFGVRVTVHPSWLIVFVLAVAWLALSGVPISDEPAGPAMRWIVATAVTALFFASVLVHELAHAFVARSRGVPVDEVTLFVFGAGTRVDREAATPATEAIITAAGPIASATVGVLFLGGGWLAGGWLAGTAIDAVRAPVARLLLGLGVINLLLAVFNLLPGFPMDGGRLLRALLWGWTNDVERATRMATIVARGFAYLVMAAGLAAALTVDPILGLWTVIVGWFLHRAAIADSRRRELAQLVEGVTVRDVMEEDVAVVGPNLTLDTLVDQHAMVGSADLYPVTAEGGLIGTIEMRQVRRVPRGRWPETRVVEVMSQGARLSTLTVGRSAMDAVASFQESGASAIPVVDETDTSRLLGLVTRNGLVRALRRRRELGGG